jgi:hypothetical protein
MISENNRAKTPKSDGGVSAVSIFPLALPSILY